MFSFTLAKTIDIQILRQERFALASSLSPKAEFVKLVYISYNDSRCGAFFALQSGVDQIVLEMRIFDVAEREICLNNMRATVLVGSSHPVYRITHMQSPNICTKFVTTLGRSISAVDIL